MGEMVGTAVLKEADVLLIREQYTKGSMQVELAGLYGVQQMTISKIVRRVTWKHI